MLPRIGRGVVGAAPQAAITPSSSGRYVTSTVPARQPMAERRPRPKHKPKAKGKATGVPGINQYLAGDTTYNDQISQLQKQLEQFRSSNANQQGMVNQDFTTALDKMNKQRTQDTGSMTSDFGSRGLLNSGLFTKSLGDYNNNWLSQQSELGTSQQRSLSQLLEDLANMQTENSSAVASAKQDAIRRRAQKYGITV